jgi:hypothetical protein
MPDGSYSLVSDTPICRDFMGWLERIVDNTFDYMDRLEGLERAEIPAPIAEYLNVDGHNFYIVEADALYKELESIIASYTDELKCLCKSLGFTRTTVEGEDVCLGDLRGNTTLPVNKELVSESVDKRNRAMTAEFVEGLMYAWIHSHNPDRAGYDAFRFIAAYDY